LLFKLLLFCADNITFLILIDFGVISSISSSVIKCIACSKVNGGAGFKIIFSSFPAARIFVSFFSLQGFTSRSIALLFSQTALGAMFLTMEVEFLGVLQIMMMATEMSIMAIFMVMFMMDPGGMGEMDMTHQKRLSLIAGFVSFVGAVAVAVFIDWGPITTVAIDSAQQTRDLGFELLGRSMLVFGIHIGGMENHGLPIGGGF